MTPHDNRDSDLGEGRQNRQPDPATRDTAAGQHDNDLSPGDTDDRPTQQANESSYAATPATHGQRPADAETVHGGTRPVFRIEIDDGHVIASVDSTLTDAAADVLWRIVEKAMRKEETR